MHIYIHTHKQCIHTKYCYNIIFKSVSITVLCLIIRLDLTTETMMLSKLDSYTCDQFVVL